MSKRALCLAVGAIAVLHLPDAARAGTEYPFAITYGRLDDIAMWCTGPWFRNSGCQRIDTVNPQHIEFYYADDNEFSAVGQWTCTAYLEGDCNLMSIATSVQFCGPGLGDYPEYVDLVLGRVGREQYALTVNQPSSCAAAKVRAVLGQNGEDDASPAQDTDTYSFAGKPGQKVEIRIGRDGSSGSAGEVAALRVRAANGAVLGQRTGAVPLSLDVTLPGTVEIAVSRQPGHGDPLRGYYELEVMAKSGDIGERKLRPAANVEH